MVSTSGPAIQSDLNIGNSLDTWLTIGYLVSSTVVVPIYGRLGDLCGRKVMILIAWRCSLRRRCCAGSRGTRPR